MAFVGVSVNINEKAIADKIDALANDETTMLEIHNLLAKMCNPYVPYLHGPLSETAEISSKSVRYIQPYARYQYYGTHFNHTVDVHPQATALWDKVMLSEHRDEFVAQVRAILRRRVSELYGG